MNENKFLSLSPEAQRELIRNADRERASGIGDAESTLDQIRAEYQLTLHWQEDCGLEIVSDQQGNVGILYDASGPMMLWLEDSESLPFVVVWHTEHACGEIGRFATEQEAHNAGAEWFHEMMSLETAPCNPEDDDNIPYDYEILEDPR